VVKNYLTLKKFENVIYMVQESNLEILITDFNKNNNIVLRIDFKFKKLIVNH
jgi:hypothetical protein